MFICLCKNVTDSQIKQCVRNGARNLRQVRNELPIATQCCKCIPDAKQIITQELKFIEKSNVASDATPFGAFNIDHLPA